MTPAAMAMMFLTAPPQLDTDHVLVGIDAKIGGGENVLHFFGGRQTATGRGDDRGRLACHFAGEARAGKNRQMFRCHTRQGFLDDPGHG